jgi:hypothetical protein
MDTERQAADDGGVIAKDVKTLFPWNKNHAVDGLLAGRTKAHTVPARQPHRPNEPDGSLRKSSVQLSFALLLCLIDLKAEQKERDDGVLTHLCRPIGARHGVPRPVIRCCVKYPESAT